ncbi:MAG: glycosyltransferase family 39 protein [Actinomycetota bacterium]
MRAPLIIGVGGFALAFAFSWVPSLWFDEAATVSATGRSWGELAAMLQHVDLVHGAYYSLTKLWFGLVGYSPLTLRLPSAIAIGVATALIVVLVRMLATPRVAVIAGILFALLPRVTWAGTEGRSYALTTAVATALVLVFVGAQRRDSKRWWVLYCAAGIVACVVFLYLALLVLALAISARRPRPTIATAVIALSVSPFALLASRQTAQVHWLGPLDLSTLHDVFVAQWFYFDDAFAVFAWLLIVIGGVILFRRRGELAGIVLGWLAVPTIALLLASLIDPVYSARYLSFSAPAAAIVMAVAVDVLGSNWQRAFAIVVCAALLAPVYVSDRKPRAKQNSNWPAVAALIESKKATGDAIVWGQLLTHGVATSRVIEYAYPSAFTGLTDVTLKRPATVTGKLWESTYHLQDVLYRLKGADHVWYVTTGSTASVTAELGVWGCEVRSRWNFGNSAVVEYGR